MSRSLEQDVIPGSILEFSPRFHELRGATLEWWLFKVSHRTLMLRVLHGDKTIGIMHFGSTVQMNIVPVMHNVRLRMASEEENNLYHFGLSGWLARYAGEEFVYSGFSLRNGRCIIECDEGTFSIWSEFLWFNWTKDPQLELQKATWPSGEPIYDMEAPLWKGGPSFPEL